MEENKRMPMPWQISTSGLVLGFFFGVVPLLISLVANHQYKQGKEVTELIKAYNIILILAIILIVLLIILWFVVLVGAIAAAGSSSFYY